MIKNTLLGIAIGDSYGFGLEFSSRDWILQNVDFSHFVNNLKSKWAENYKEGRYTDDTEMTIGLMNAMMDKRVFSEELLLEHWKAEYDWFYEDKNILRPGHGSIKEYYNKEASIEDIRKLQGSKQYPGNAPPMRAVPLGFAGEKLEEYAIINADATHPHPKARAASIIVARAAKYILVKNGDKKDLIKYCGEFIKEIDAETYQYLKAIDSLKGELTEKDYELLCGPQPISNFPIKNLYGLATDAMRTAGAALHTIKYAENPFDALKRSIQYGGDVDSLAAITVGITAGRDGLESIPQYMQDKIEDKNRLERIAEDFEKKII
ncbi:MAG: ADP-ribosylglycohydrolase family protein [Nanoarchaeota archaeon]|nr:ADP-ribosylglycohydrolase family protein [Nanoarchaeota archaeon]MBU1270170.1 ADP-ribosylglycohydrolase family protein [Nanoarchaeota archaeon]MBU1604340.1 ADP-ribosylglycohydrolase family protein [Nanoarchaeota archaeon]MBU2443489.1 ADP-ribosylglycohydrolase family protein [Nanoarchaeota archaeon]